MISINNIKQIKPRGLIAVHYFICTKENNEQLPQKKNPMSNNLAIKLEPKWINYIDFWLKSLTRGQIKYNTRRIYTIDPISNEYISIYDDAAQCVVAAIISW